MKQNKLYDRIVITIPDVIAGVAYASITFFGLSFFGKRQTNYSLKGSD